MPQLRPSLSKKRQRCDVDNGGDEDEMEDEGWPVGGDAQSSPIQEEDVSHSWWVNGLKTIYYHILGE